MITADIFIAKAEEIAAEGPAYEKGKDGSNGLCDCIGLIIGSIRRAGGQWRGLHGSNYAVRSELDGKVQLITGAGDLRRGELVFKAYEPSEKGYDLPDKYRPGGASYNGDVRDYYHVGIVVSVSPLRIRHMTTPKPALDTKLGRWKYHGWCKKISCGDADREEIPMGLYQAKVVGDGMLNMRKGPDSKAARIMQLPVGSVVDVLEETNDAWRKISYAEKIGFAMAKYLEQDVASGTKIAVDRSVLEAIYDEIGDMLGLRG